MNILFDFDLLGNEQVDAHLTDMLLAWKAEVKRAYQELEISKPEKITVVLTAKPGEFSLICLAQDDQVAKVIQEHLHKAVDFERAVKIAGRKDLN